MTDGRAETMTVAAVLEEPRPAPAASEAALPLVSSFTVNTAGDAIAAVCGDVVANGMEYRSSPQSMNADKRIREVINCTVAIRAPERRLPRFGEGAFSFSPGLAAARFLYLLSGSDSYPQIAFYTNGALRFALEGRNLPGSAYGARLFGNGNDANLFEETAQVLLARPNTKRASIPIFQPRDTLAAGHTPDLPCAFGVHFLLRDAGLISSVTMRANDALKIMPYNLFEFSLLAECMAARIGARHAAHVHGSVSMHLRDDAIAAAGRIAARPIPCRTTPPVGMFDERVRAAVCASEYALRALGRGPRPDNVFDMVPPLLDAGPWRDLLLAASLASAAADGRGEPAAELMAEAIADNAEEFPLTQAEVARLLDLPAGSAGAR